MRHIILSIPLVALISACGGGGGGSTDLSPLPSTTLTSNESGTSNDPTLLPDFRALDLTLTRNDALTGIATVSNEGQTGGEIPPSWLLVGTDSSMSEYHHLSVVLWPLTDNYDTWLEPGETQTFAVRDQLFQYVSMPFAQRGTHYGALELNPDLSTRFEDFGEYVAPSRLAEELIYDNNRSPISTFNVEILSNVPDCVPDQYEPNDSAEQATPVVIGQIYDFTACDDHIDVVSIELSADATYEVVQSPDKDHFTTAVVGPDGKYINRGHRNDLFKTERSGTHLIVFTSPLPFMRMEFSMEIVEK